MYSMRAFNKTNHSRWNHVYYSNINHRAIFPLNGQAVLSPYNDTE